MAEIADLGHIRSIGVSNFHASKMAHAFDELEKHGYPLVSNQVKYNLLDRQIEGNGVLERAEELGITIIAYSPLEMGLLTGKFHEQPTLIDNRPFGRRRILKSGLNKSKDLISLLGSIAAEHHVSVSQVALNWLITFRDNVVAIPGATKVSHVEQNAGALKFRLSKEQLNAIDNASQQFI